MRNWIYSTLVMMTVGVTACAAYTQAVDSVKTEQQQPETTGRSLAMFKKNR